MPRHSTIREKLDRITRKYKHVSPDRYFYNKKSELKGRFNRIAVWFLIHDKDRGRSIFPIEFKRKVLLSVPEWKQFFKAAPKQTNYKPLFQIFTQDILPAINNKSGAAWRFVALIGWTGAHDIRQSKNSDSHNNGDTPTKKRNANARNTNRRRHRNRKR